jgi:CheY-like chemotaxis protein
MPDTRLRLLVVDDEPSLRTSISLVLREFGYDVRSAGNGFSALSEIRNAAPDILISDLNMPGM